MAPWPFYRAEKLALAVEETSAHEEAGSCYPAAFEEFNPPSSEPPIRQEGPTKPIEKELISLRPGPAAKSEVVAHSLGVERLSVRRVVVEPRRDRHGRKSHFRYGSQRRREG